MTRTPDASAAHEHQRQRLLALLADGHIDAALRAGLMDFPADESQADAPLRATQARLRQAWAARERYRARESRLARIATEREARRRATATPHAATAGADAPGTTAAAVATPAAPALPAAAAAALARARAKAAGNGPA